MQKELDSIKLAKSDALDQAKTQQLTEDSPFIINGNIGVVGNISSGKSSLISKLMVIYKKKINPQIFYFTAHGQIDETTSENLIKHEIPVVSITSNNMEEFLIKYKTIKMMVMELFKYYTTDDYWSESLQEMKESLKVNTLKNKAEELIKKYSNPSEIKAGNKTYKIDPMIVKNKFTYCLLVFDDLAQFPQFTGRGGSNLFRDIFANTRHWLATSIWGAQRFTFMKKDARSLTNTWCLGYGLSSQDVSELLKQTVSVEGFTSKELVELYEEIERYEFLCINPGFAVVEKITVNL